MYFTLLVILKQCQFLMLIKHLHFRYVENIQYHVAKDNHFKHRQHEEQIAKALVLIFFQLKDLQSELQYLKFQIKSY
jgi:hypothetical protein